MILVLTPYLQIHRKSKESKEIDFAIPHWFAFFFPTGTQKSELMFRNREE